MPHVRYHAAMSVADAAAALASEPNAVLLAGGTDVVPKLKRRQQTADLLVSLRRVDALRGIASNGEMAIGAMTTIADIVRHTPADTALGRAAAQIATPLIRNSATIGGNLALDTRCNDYDQSLEWRTAIGFCMKTHRNAICQVAPSSPRCWAVASSDLAPALIALGARITLVSRDGERDLPLEDLYRDDGIEPLAKRREEILTTIRIPATGTKSTYLKLRRRGSFDFPVLGVGAAVDLDRGVVTRARLTLGAVASRPILIPESDLLVGTTLDDDTIEHVAAHAARHAKPLDNTDFQMTWRKNVAKTFVARALRALRNGG